MADNRFSRITDSIKRISGNAFSHQLGIFLIFLAISTLLWMATSLNEEVQRQLECEVEVTHVPDSVTFISEPPASIMINVRGRGTQFMRYLLGAKPSVTLDFRYYSKDNRFSVNKSTLLELIQNTLGDDPSIQAIAPDSIGVYYTSLKPIRLPVKVAVTATTTPAVCLYGAITSQTDSVSVYAIGRVAEKLRYISTEDIRFTNIAASTTRKVKMVAPTGCRVIPDSVTVHINVEPIVTEVRDIDIVPVNVPAGIEQFLLTPAKVRTSFRVPRSQRDRLPEVKVIADFNTLSKGYTDKKIGIRTTQLLPNVFLELDSVDYYVKEARSTVPLMDGLESQLPEALPAAPALQ